MNLDQEISDFTIGLLLRYFGSSVRAEVDQPTISMERDREFLRLHWALSPSVSELISYVIENRHEIQTVLDDNIRFEDAVVRGRLDAIATMRRRVVSGSPTAVVSREPVRSYESPPNLLLGWVISQAWSLASRFAKISLDSDSYKASVDAALQRLENVRRLQAISTLVGMSNLGRRPSLNAIKEASRSRRQLYRKAAEAYRTLLSLEAGDLSTIANTLRNTLLAPLEPWRRYELAVAFAVSHALSDELEKPMALNLLVGNVRIPVAVVGPFAIYWQWATTAYVKPQPEPSEEIARSILTALGISEATDRPDIVVTKQSEVVSIIEVKYLTGEDASDRVRAAVHQLVRYCRGYRAILDVGSLLRNSVVAVTHGLHGLASTDATAPVPNVLDFESIRQRQLRAWARQMNP